MTHMIEMKKVSKFYSTNGMVSTGFSKVDLNLDLGEFVVITGESGGGKSTLLNVISGLDGYEEGEMLVAGQDTGTFGTEQYENYRKTFIGNVFQDHGLINSYTVYQNVELALLLVGRKGGDRRRVIKSILERLGLQEYAKVKVSKLSGGQKQKVAIARALAKDAPIIVADEPTGNLDSDAAKNVMEALHRVSEGKLVVVVTHNYEQAQPYATRKIMMRDGRIVEDRKLNSPRRHADSEVMAKNSASLRSGEDTGVKSGGLSPASQLRLGVRNTFNLPAKFVLLLFIFIFMTVAVMGGYTSKLSAESEESVRGRVDFFFDKSPERLIMHRKDKKAFSEADFERILRNPNIKRIVKKDTGLDSSVQAARGNFHIEGIMYDYNTLAASDLSYGRLPKKSDEMVVGTEKLAENYEEIRKQAKDLLGKRFKLTSFSEQDGKEGKFTDKKIRIVGISFKKSGNAELVRAGYSRLYCSREILNMHALNKVAESSKIGFDFGGKKTGGAGSQHLRVSGRVPRGKVFASESEVYPYYGNRNAVGRKVGISVTTNYFRTSKPFIIGKLINKKNIESVLGISRSKYDEYSEAIFVNKADFKALFDNGDYQISAFMKEHMNADQTVSELEKEGYRVLSLKKVMEWNRGRLDILNMMFRNVMLAILLLALFFIAYVVIVLVMRSRNTYYSTLRIIGATRRNIANLLRIELLTVMIVALAIVGAFVFAVNTGVISLSGVNSVTKFIKPQNYMMLIFVMIVISLLIASRYSRKIFAKSAMTAYRAGGVS